MKNQRESEKVRVKLSQRDSHKWKIHSQIDEFMEEIILAAKARAKELKEEFDALEQEQKFRLIETQ